jgi:hypothetical protein
VTDAPLDDGEAVPECFGPLPSDLHFPLYGLSDAFTGERFLFQWERLLGMDRPAPNPVSWVALVHKSGTRLLEVISCGKQPMTWSGHTGSRMDIGDVADRALFQHFSLVSARMPLGDVRGQYIREQLPVIRRLAQDLVAPEWEHISIVVQGEPKDALVYRQGGAWAAMADLDDKLAIGICSIGIQPDEYELVIIEDLSRYPSQMLAEPKP